MQSAKKQTIGSESTGINFKQNGDLGVTDPWDPEQNIDGGSRYIREQLDNFGDLRRAIAAYHAGPGNVRIPTDARRLIGCRGSRQ